MTLSEFERLIQGPPGQQPGKVYLIDDWLAEPPFGRRCTWQEWDDLCESGAKKGVCKMQMYLVGAWVKPTAEEAEKGVEGFIVLEPKAVLASSPELAKVSACRGLAETTPLGRLVICILPFQG